MGHRIWIRNADVVLPSGVERTDVLIEGTRIVAIGAGAGTQADEVVDATGLVLMPGVVDSHLHFRDPGLTWKEDLYTGSRACAKGGVTSFLEMPNTNPLTISQAQLEAKLALAKHKSIVNYGFYIGATVHNVGELSVAHRTPGIKIFIGSSTGDMLVDDQETLERIFAETKIPICAHCEDETTVNANKARLGANVTVHDHSRVRDEAAAVIATKRAMDLADRHRHNFHVLHVSTGAEADLLKTASHYLTGEVCPHHLFFTVDDYDRLGSRIQMNPSVKTKADTVRLWQALHEGSIQAVVTDHAPHTLEEKAQPYPKSPSGMPAVENSLALMLNQVNQGRITLPQVVSWMCDAPARIWNMVGKGRIAEGFDADLVLVDLNKVKTIRDEEQETRVRWSPWHGDSLQGWPVRTWVMGHEVFRDGVIDDSKRGSEITFDLGLGGFWKTADSGTARG